MLLQTVSKSCQLLLTSLSSRVQLLVDEFNVLLTIRTILGLPQLGFNHLNLE